MTRKTSKYPEYTDWVILIAHQMLLLDLLLSYKMLEVISPSNPLYKWHGERIAYLEATLVGRKEKTNALPS